MTDLQSLKMQQSDILMRDAYHKQCDEIIKLKDKNRRLETELRAVYAGLALGLKRGGKSHFTTAIAEALQKAGFNIAQPKPPCAACHDTGRLADHPCPVCGP